MGILDVKMDGVRLGWNSPVKEVVHPSHIDLESRGGLGWLEGFNEWMVRCGLEFAGHPGTDQFINNSETQPLLISPSMARFKISPLLITKFWSIPIPLTEFAFGVRCMRAFFTAPSSSSSPRFPPCPGLKPFRFPIS